MKRIIEDNETSGLESLLGKQVLLLCANYFYTGELIGVNTDFVLLKNPAIVYETGEWKTKGYQDSQKLHVDVWHVSTNMIESYGETK